MRWPFASLAALAWSLPGCLAYNDQCSFEKTTTLGYTDVQLDIRPAVLRSMEAPIGNLVADAMMRAALDEATDAATLAAIDAGAFSSATPCGPRDMLPLGILSSADVTDLLGTSEQIVVLRLDKAGLLRTLERSVSTMGDRATALEATQFLQVSADLSFEVNCDNLAQLIDGASLARDGLRVDPRTVTLSGGTLADWPDEQPIYLVTTATLASGPLGYFDLGRAEMVRTLNDPLHVAVGKRIAALSPIHREDVLSWTTAGVDGQRGRIRPYPNCYQ